VVVLLEEIGDICKRLNIQHIVKKFAAVVNNINLAKKNENYASSDAMDEPKGDR